MGRGSSTHHPESPTRYPSHARPDPFTPDGPPGGPPAGPSGELFLAWHDDLERPLAIGERLAVAAIGQDDGPVGEGRVQHGERQTANWMIITAAWPGEADRQNRSGIALIIFLRRPCRRSTMKMNLLTKSSDKNTRRWFYAWVIP